MSVREKFGLCGWRDGYTWLLGIAWMTENSGKLHGMGPAYEVEWDDKGNAIHTGRRAWLTKTAIEQSQMVTPELGHRYEPDPARGERELTQEEYAEMLTLRQPPAVV